MRARFLYLAGLMSVFLCLGAQAALLPIGQDTSSPFYADFSNKGLDVSYTFANGVGTISVSNHTGIAKSGEGYTSGASAAGTHGQGHSGTATTFNGFYTLNATVSQNTADGNQWEVTGGNFSVQGDLFNVGNPSHQQDLLLTGLLRTGNGSFGFDSSLKVLEFLFTTGTTGNSSILADFMGPQTGDGGIILNWNGLGALSSAFSLTGNWFNNGSGTVDTFVPEPAWYPFTAAGIALLGLVTTRRKSLA